MKQGPKPSGAGGRREHGTESLQAASFPNPGPQEMTPWPLELVLGSLPGTCLLGRAALTGAELRPSDFHGHLCLGITAALFLGKNY